MTDATKEVIKKTERRRGALIDPKKAKRMDEEGKRNECTSGRLYIAGKRNGNTNYINRNGR
jgi:hypothetical protein